jgi:hypothetical protein
MSDSAIDRTLITSNAKVVCYGVTYRCEATRSVLGFVFVAGYGKLRSGMRPRDPELADNPTFQALREESSIDRPIELPWALSSPNCQNARPDTVMRQRYFSAIQANTPFIL